MNVNIINFMNILLTTFVVHEVMVAIQYISDHLSHYLSETVKLCNFFFISKNLP